jgi:hypothetical protein
MTGSPNQPADTERRILELEAWARSRGWRAPAPAKPDRRRTSRRRSLLVSALLALVAVMPMTVIASDEFTDVPDSHLFHDDINWIYSRRITTGCGGLNFCPDANVTRGQMAAFMRRGFGRISGGTSGGAGVILTEGWQTIATVNVDGGGGTGGTGMALVTAAMSIGVGDATNCPCIVFYRISGAGVDTINFGLQVEAGVEGYDSGAATWWFQVPSGVSVPISVQAQYYSGNGTVGATATITAIYAPFGSPLP